MALLYDTSVRLKWAKVPDQICANLPWQVELTAHRINDDEVDEEPAPLNGVVSVRQMRAFVALEENFADCQLGKWKMACEAHYEYGFDEDVSATGLPSMFLKGGNDSNFGMVMTMQPSKSDGAFEEESNTERPELEAFQPDRVTFYVRTDSPNSDAGHFILGETNEVSKRVAQFQFTREGFMGLLGSGGASFGAVPYVPHVWYRIDLTFNWEKKDVDFYVNCKLEERSIPFRRTSSSFIGACALGNRDTCTTWFDTFAFTHEEDVCINQLPLVEGRAAGWCAPSMRDHPIWLHAVIEPNRAGESVRAKADALVAESPLHVSAPGAFSRLGPVTPMCAREVAQRIALNEAALHNLRSMLDDEATADVVLNVEGERIYAHRCVLVSRCETFKLMLSSGLAEGRPAAEHSGADGAALPRAGGEGASARSPLWTITVHETEPTVFRKMLEFLYAGAVDIDPEHAPDLLALADQYMLPGLKLLCGFALKQSITIETVCRIYQSADRFDCKGSELKQQCLNFILHNYDAIVKTDHWDELTASPHLLVEVTRAVASTRKEGSPSGPHNQRKRARD